MYVHIGTGNRESGKVKVNIPSSIENKAKSNEERKMEETKKVFKKIVKAEKSKLAEIDPTKPEFKVPKIPLLKRLSGDVYSEIEL